MSRKNDFLLIAVVLLVALALLAVQGMFRNRTRSLDELTADATLAPDAVSDWATQQPFGPALPESEEPVAGYVLIGVGTEQYGDLIPMDHEKIITIRQDDDHINQVRITRDSVEMLSSTCENQDCVHQGTVTLENYTTRALQAFILCLPNTVSIELIPAQNIQEE